MQLKYLTLKWLVRWSLFGLVLVVGTSLTMILDETASSALVDLSHTPVQDIVAGGPVLYAHVADNASAMQLYRSRDNGQTWQALSSEPSLMLHTLTVHPGEPTTLYAGGQRTPMSIVGNLWRSEDSGQTWHKFNLNLPADPQGYLPEVTALTIQPHTTDYLYVGTDGRGVYRVDLNRLGYELISDSLLDGKTVRHLAVGAGQTLYALTDNGLLVSDNDHWTRLALPDTAVSMAVGTRLYVGSASTGVYHLDDNGETWQALNLGLEMIPGAALRVSHIAVDPDNPAHLAVTTMYGIGKGIAPGHIYESTNAGQVWVQVTELDTAATYLALNQGVIHVATDNGLSHYGDTLPAPTLTPDGPQVFNGTQGLVALLTMVLAGMMLLAPTEQLFKREL